ncbi:MAG TPA: hypothetical protein VND93_27700 [Myxococcales bacterium]|jgi:hypothetical protein|nr:hypothetical protein [Myxococcales bacterium]
MPPRNLDVPLRNEIDAMFREARARIDAGKKDEAVPLARQAWDKLPEPKYDWDVTQSYTIALAAILRDAGLYQEALRVMEDDFASGVVLPYQDQPRIMMGSIYAELGDRTKAKKWIGEANLISKGRCFFGMWLKYRSYVD